ncbi:MAG: phytanoyl-CoA dioxygenase, partial [Aldersonia sp.]|nr:phytanoyl-CoA dioxygenase [Aldersonia sp.]
MTTALHRRGRWITEVDCSLDAFRAALDHPTRRDDYPFAESVTDGVLVYDSDRLRSVAATRRRDVQTELLAALSDGP